MLCLNSSDPSRERLGLQLFDAVEQRQYADFSSEKALILSCRLFPSDGEQKPCNSKASFSAFVAGYMESAPIFLKPRQSHKVAHTKCAYWLMGNHFWLALPFAGQRASVLGAGVFFFSALPVTTDFTQKVYRPHGQDQGIDC